MRRKLRANAFSTERRLESLEDLPNVGPSLARSLRLVGVARPAALKGKDPYSLYRRLCQRTGVRHDPCVIDVFISAVRYVEGAPLRRWWFYTPERKTTLSQRGERARASQ